MITYRWLEPEEVMDWCNPVLQQQGWALLGEATSRVLAAFEDTAMVGFIVLQMYPMVGPAYVDPDHRNGKISRGLASQMDEFLNGMDARGYMVVATNPASAHMAEQHGMVRLEDPVYVKGA